MAGLWHTLTTNLLGKIVLVLVFLLLSVVAFDMMRHAAHGSIQ